MINDVYTIVLTGKIKRTLELDERCKENLIAYVLRGNLYHSPQSTLWCGSDKIFYLNDSAARDLQPDFNQTIKAVIEPCTDTDGNELVGEFNIIRILEIEPLPFEQR